jgi:hypothetical protein
MHACMHACMPLNRACSGTPASGACSRTIHMCSCICVYIYIYVYTYIYMDIDLQICSHTNYIPYIYMHTAYLRMYVHIRALSSCASLAHEPPPSLTHARAPYRRGPHWRQPAAPRADGTRVRSVHNQARARSCCRL